MTLGGTTLIGRLSTYSVPCGKDMGSLQPGDILVVDGKPRNVIFYADERKPASLHSRPDVALGQAFITDTIDGVYRVMVVTAP